MKNTDIVEKNKNYFLDIKYSIIYSFISKLVTIANQALVFPLLLVAVGSEKFAIFNVVIASVGWMFLFNGTLTPSLVKIFSRSENNFKERTKAFQVSLILIILFFYFFLSILHYSLSFNFINEYIHHQTGLLYTVFILSFLNIFLSLFSSIRQGLNQQYINNLLGGLGNLISLLLSLTYYYYDRNSLVELALVFLSGPIIVNVFFMFPTVIKNKYIFKQINFFDIKYAFDFIKTSSLFFLIQGSIYINQQLSLILSSSLIDLQSVTDLSFIFKYYMVLGGFITMIFQPTWPAISNAISNKNYQWVEYASNKLQFFLISYGFFIFIFTLFFGEKIFILWTNNIVKLDSLSSFYIGCYFFSYVYLN